MTVEFETSRRAEDAPPRSRIVRDIVLGTAAVVVVIGLAYWQLTDGNLSILTRAFAAVDWRIAPDFAAFARAPFVIQLHASTAIGALLLGLVQMFAPKGTIPHRAVGYVWAVLMVTTAISAIFIRQINGGNFSFIHIFVPITLMSVFGMIAHARRGLIQKHRSAVFGAFFGALVIPGLFAFMPGRLMHAILFGG